MTGGSIDSAGAVSSFGSSSSGSWSTLPAASPGRHRPASLFQVLRSSCFEVSTSSRASRSWSRVRSHSGLIWLSRVYGSSSDKTSAGVELAFCASSLTSSAACRHRWRISWPRLRQYCSSRICARHGSRCRGCRGASLLLGVDDRELPLPGVLGQVLVVDHDLGRVGLGAALPLRLGRLDRGSGACRPHPRIDDHEAVVAGGRSLLGDRRSGGSAGAGAAAGGGAGRGASARGRAAACRAQPAVPRRSREAAEKLLKVWRFLYPAIAIFEPHDVVELRGRDLDDVAAVRPRDHAVPGEGRDVVGVAAAEGRCSPGRRPPPPPARPRPRRGRASRP